MIPASMSLNQSIEFLWQSHTCTHFTALWIVSRTTRVSRYQKKHSPTHTYRGHQSSLVCFVHLSRSVASMAITKGYIDKYMKYFVLVEENAFIEQMDRKIKKATDQPRFNWTMSDDMIAACSLYRVRTDSKLLFSRTFHALQRSNSRVFQDSQSSFSTTFQDKFGSNHGCIRSKKCTYQISYQCNCITVNKSKCNN